MNATKYRCSYSSADFYEQPDGEWVDADDYDALAALMAECEADRLEQCRLNGMGGEREAHLLARIDRAERLLRECGRWLPKEHRGPGYSDFLARVAIALGVSQDDAALFPHPGFVTAEEMNKPFGPADGSGDWSRATVSADVRHGAIAPQERGLRLGAPKEPERARGCDAEAGVHGQAPANRTTDRENAGE